jgi:hypothetical protein
MLDRDDEQYAHYFVWKRAPLKPKFLEIVSAYGGDPKSRLCAKVAAVRSAAAPPGLLRRWLGC